MKRMFGNMVKEKHIEFFIKPNDPRSGVYSIPNKFCYLPFIHPTINGDDCKLSDFSIFTPNDCTYPFQYRSTEGVVRKVTLKYKTKFHVSELVHDLFVALRHSTDHILYEGIKDLLKYYFVDDNEPDTIYRGNNVYAKTNSNDWSRVHDKFKFVVSAKRIKHEWRYWDKPAPVDPMITLNHDRVYENISDDVQQYNLYIIPNKAIDVSRNIRLRIKFISTDKRGDDPNFKHDGLPLIAWVSCMDTVEYVIDKYMHQSKRFILSCFVVKNNQEGIKKSVIHRNKWDKIALSSKMDPTKDYLLFRFKPFSDCNIVIPQFENSVHDFVDDPMQF